MLFTLTYSDGFEGWPSFYSYYPDWMLGMNNYFYTWRGGDLYQHNDSAQARNTFYYDYWVKKGQPGNAFTPSSIESVFNQTVLENALFKTIDIQGDDPWETQLSTDIQSSGYIERGWFEKKEQTYFAFIRNDSTGELPIRSTTGIGSTKSMNPIPILPPSSLVDLFYEFVIDSIISVGDIIYYGSGPSVLGTITNITRGPSTTTVTVITPPPSIPPWVSPVSPQVYTLYTKNSVAESHGVLGHYCTFTMQNPASYKVELFAVESDVMKSYP